MLNIFVNLKKVWKMGFRQLFFRQSLTVKIVFTVSLVFCFLVGVGTFALVKLTKKAIAENSVTTALYQTQLLKMKLIESMLNDNPKHEDLVSLLDNLRSRGVMDEVNIYNEDGHVRFSSVPENLGKEVSLTADERDRFTSDDALIQLSPTNPRGRLRIVHPIKGGAQCSVCHLNQKGEYLGGIELFVPLEPIYKRFGESRFLFVALAVFIIGMGALVIRWLVHKIVRHPIKEMIQVMEKAQKGELDVRTHVEKDPDLKQLAKSFNSMVKGIREAQDTLRKQHEKEMTQSNRLASLGLVISNVSHEIKNPLASLSSALHVLKNEFESREDAEIFKELNLQIGRIQQTVNNLLRFAKQAPPFFEYVSVLQPIQHALELIHDRLEEKKIQTKIVHAVSDTIVYADAGQLEQVFLNLFLNAAASMKSGGRLLIAINTALLPSPRISSDMQRRGLKISVSDTGCGILDEEVTRIFEPFFTTKKGGTGLGLSVVKGIIDAHEGMIEVESSVGKGTTMIIYIPSEA